MVNVEIDDRDPLQAPGLQNARRDRDVVEGTEALTMVREGMMKAAPDVASHAKV